MGFSWTPITQFVTEIAAAHQNEIKANVDIVYSDLALSQYGWVYLPVSTDEEMLHEHFQEMRDAIDYADDMNYCRSHDTGYNADDKATHRATVYSSEKTGYDSTDDIGVDGAYDSGIQGSYNAGVDEGYDSQVYSGEDVSEDGYDYADHAGTYRLYEYSYQDGVVCSGD